MRPLTGSFHSVDREKLVERLGSSLRVVLKGFRNVVASLIHLFPDLGMKRPVSRVANKSKQKEDKSDSGGSRGDAKKNVKQKEIDSRSGFSCESRLQELLLRLVSGLQSERESSLLGGRCLNDGLRLRFSVARRLGVIDWSRAKEKKRE